MLTVAKEMHVACIHVCRKKHTYSIRFELYTYLTGQVIDLHPPWVRPPHPRATRASPGALKGDKSVLAICPKSSPSDSWTPDICAWMRTSECSSDTKNLAQSVSLKALPSFPLLMS